MKLTSEQVKKVSKLANLPLTPEEEEKYSEQLSKVLSYIEQLNKVDTSLGDEPTSDVEPTFNVTGESNVMSEDETGECLTQEDALLNAPKVKNNMFETKGVFEE